MATVATKPIMPTPAAARSLRDARLRWRDDLVTVALGLWLMVGIFVDGWAHNNLAKLETFFTPWHALFYAAFAANALWIGWLMRYPRAGRIGRWGLPVGYDLSLVGVFVFGMGGFADMIWHSLLGIEVSTQALLSPPHLVLFVGVLLIVTAPLRSAWAFTEAGSSTPGFRAFLPALLSATELVGFTVFMNMELWGLGGTEHTQVDILRNARLGLTNMRARSLAETTNLAQILITTVLLIAPVLFLLRRWRLPFGSVTLMFTVVSLLMGGMLSYIIRYPERVVAMMLAGLGIDLLVRQLRPSATRITPFRAFAFLAPVVLWGLHFLIVPWRAGGEGWSIELWAGITIMAGLTGLGLSLLIVPPEIPALLVEDVASVAD